MHRSTLQRPKHRHPCRRQQHRYHDPPQVQITVNEVAVSENCSITTPTADDIIACNDLEELLNLGTPLAEKKRIHFAASIEVGIISIAEIAPADMTIVAASVSPRHIVIMVAIVIIVIIFIFAD